MDEGRIAALRERFKDYPAIQRLIGKIAEPPGLFVVFGTTARSDAGDTRFLTSGGDELPLDWLERLAGNLDSVDPAVVGRLDHDVAELLKELEPPEVVPLRTGRAADEAAFAVAAARGTASDSYPEDFPTRTVDEILGRG